MRKDDLSRTLFITLAAIVITGAVVAANAQTVVTQVTIDELTANWPAKSREVATTVISKYGLPQETTASMLIWNGNGPWKRTILYRDPVPHDFPKPHVDLLEQFIDYGVPPDKFDELALYDGSVIAERTKGELSARCDKEEMNFLALNLAHDIVIGRRTVNDARRFYAETAMAAMRGETPQYIQRLRFEPQVARAADRDRPFQPQAMTSSVTADQEAQTRIRRSKD